MRIGRIVQIIISLLGILGCFFSFGLALMVSHSALSSEYPMQVYGAAIFLLTFLYAFLIFLVSIFKPSVLVGFYLVPIFFTISQHLEDSTYNIDHQISPIPNHQLIGKVVKFNETVYLKSNMPKKRLRNYSTLCFHDFKLSKYSDLHEVPKDYWGKHLKTKYQVPKVEVLKPPQSFTVTHAFNCGRLVTLGLKDPNGRLIEVFEFEIE